MSARATYADEALFEIPGVTTYEPHPPPKCDECDAQAVAKVYAFTAYKPRRAYIGIGSPWPYACADHLEEATAGQLALVADEPHLIVWSLAHFSVSLPGLPETAWHEVYRVEPPWKLKADA